MTNLFCSLRRISPVLAISVLILSACGNDEGPTDVTDDPDTAVAADTIDNDTLPPDVNGRDVSGDNGGDDVTTADVAADAGDVQVGQDVTGDAVPGDVTGDTACVPDCTGGPCTDDGCGGDCCDEPNVCDKNYAGDAMVCLPTDGTTCLEMGNCSSGCADVTCVSDCYDDGSADARDALWAIMDCIAIACPQITEECAVAAYGEGGACYTEYSNCMNACVPDCSGGPCTDDGCGGDCCAAPNACQTPESGVGLECLAATEKTCQQIWSCGAECGTPECVQDCINAASADGRAQFNALVTCLNGACPGGATQECIDAAVQSGAECADEYTACT